ncbi:Uma2 family endonuclease [Megalodesulfovibrio gigas]|uniref:Putative restriction endonuclease domain-containing protein n=1 Tax=Megalodesulfovibrio gigas (strain ATCC 19364 / DSM 1382 / NCIMB 9332 / VKM B-1759) TaxID=1121448 RepID=T2GCM2_MEGG1|nr:Uma2 family endonuclease [Megalodesulfovibrio gigas]AGW13876.1 hypothetical protein DGI_2112 [Megalodesulfovibrio gigas DSM 1382 = ATCC 19364]
MGLPARIIDEYTYADYAAWPEEQRYELLDGEAVRMAAAPTVRHQRLVRTLLVLLDRQLEDSPCESLLAPTAVLLDAPLLGRDLARTVVEPDLLVICDADKIKPHGVEGAPDLVVEVLSPSTLLRDTQTKFALYDRFGVAEYWIVDPEGALLHQFVRQTADPDAVADPAPAPPSLMHVRTWTATEMLESAAVPGLTIPLHKVFAG